MNKISSIISGTLLGDASVRLWKGKYLYYSCSAKDVYYLKWLGLKYKEFGIRCYISVSNYIQEIFSLGFYINTCPYPQFLTLRKEWYVKNNGKTQKIVPVDIELTSDVLLFWYLGDGSLPKRHKDNNIIPSIVLATNCFSESDINLLIGKLKELNLNFYPIKYKSGFTGLDSGYCLYSKTEDGTPYRFFKMIGFKCPKGIANCTVGRKGRYGVEKFFKDKWPTEDDWIKILSNVKGIGKILKEKRIGTNLSVKELAQRIRVSPRFVRHIEFGDRFPSVPKFREVLKALNIDIPYLLKELGDR